MGSIKYTALVAEIKGRVGGTVFQGGKTGTIIKSWRHQSFVRILATLFGMAETAYNWVGSQAAANAAIVGRLFYDGSSNANSAVITPRQALSNVASAWAGLSSSQHTAWNDNAVNFPAKNRFGDVYTPSGFQVFVTLNTRLINVGLPLVLFPPSNENPPLASNHSDFDNEGNFLIGWDDGYDRSQDLIFVVEATPARRQGKFSHMKNYKTIAVINLKDIAQDANVRYAWEAMFGLMQENTTFGLRGHTLNPATGTISPTFETTVLIDAIASGAKLTKSDAGDIHITTTAGNSGMYTENIYGYNDGDEAVHLTITADASNTFGISGVNVPTKVKTLALPVSQTEDLLPVDIFVFAENAAAGTYTATLTFTDSDGEVIGTTLLTAVVS